ncbi:hypothetical protein BDA99DRAFT_531158 [Phascolomyces articulosus]|uniref:Uncharacterized protein n=1 Tax=Phascolomyces articulosus TaxID=60185 RepID=A0AAD5PJ74_9FUNG|nr:hypothetical protein BDA99DRAFT_531158 [Phascolomyces articulosus]
MVMMRFLPKYRMQITGTIYYLYLNIDLELFFLKVEPSQLTTHLHSTCIGIQKVSMQNIKANPPVLCKFLEIPWKVMHVTGFCIVWKHISWNFYDHNSKNLLQEVLSLQKTRLQNRGLAVLIMCKVQKSPNIHIVRRAVIGDSAPYSMQHERLYMNNYVAESDVILV